MDSLIHDARLGVRSLLRTPGFALTACLTLAVGIGLSTAVFTVADALLLRQLPVLDQDRIVVLSGHTRDRQIENWPLGFENAGQFADRTRAMSELAGTGHRLNDDGVITKLAFSDEDTIQTLGALANDLVMLAIGMTLVGFLRGQNFNIYSHAERITG